jgi:hypothetical protein
MSFLRYPDVEMSNDQLVCVTFAMHDDQNDFVSNNRRSLWAPTDQISDKQNKQIIVFLSSSRIIIDNEKRNDWPCHDRCTNGMQSKTKEEEEEEKKRKEKTQKHNTSND